MPESSRKVDHQLPRRFREVVRRIRLNAGVRITDAAEVADMKPSQWAKIENRPQKDIGVLLLCRVAAALGLSGTQLLSIIEKGDPELSSSGN